MLKPKIAATMATEIDATFGSWNASFLGVRRNLETIITFIMTKQPHSHSRDAAKASSPPLALQAASEAGLADLIARAQWLDELDRILRRCLPAALADQCRLANVDRDNLVFLVNAPVWKAKLRLEADALLRAAATAGLSVRTLVVKVAAALPISPGTTTGMPLSNAVRQSLRTTAQSVDDPGLRAQLLKLASLPDRSK